MKNYRFVVILPTPHPQDRIIHENPNFLSKSSGKALFNRFFAIFLKKSILLRLLLTFFYMGQLKNDFEKRNLRLLQAILPAADVKFFPESYNLVGKINE